MRLGMGLQCYYILYSTAASWLQLAMMRPCLCGVLTTQPQVNLLVVRQLTIYSNASLIGWSSVHRHAHQDNRNSSQSTKHVSAHFTQVSIVNRLCRSWGWRGWRGWRGERRSLRCSLVMTKMDPVQTALLLASFHSGHCSWTGLSPFLLDY